jgi:hypothetical protein
MVEPDPLDREIDALLDVEPSPAFLARMRAREHARPMAGRRWLPGWWMAAAASAMVLAAVLSFWRAGVAPPLRPPPIVPDVAALEPPAPIVIEPIRIAPLLTADLELGE